MVEKSHTAGWLPSMSEPLHNLRNRIAHWFAPASEASAADDAYDIALELPGVKTDDIDISIDGNNLTVKGEKHSETTSEGRTYYFSEREYGAFQRTFRLPPDADAGSIAATHEDGVLKLRIAKQSPKQDGARRIKISKA
jgi:HSP20 family protein